MAYQNITTMDYRSKFYQSADHVLVDVRTEREYRSGHLPNAINIPLAQLRQRTQEVPTGQPIIVVCASGNRSQDGSLILEQAGHQEVYNLQGGTMMWMMQGQPIEY